MRSIKSVKSIRKNIKGKTILLRVDFNVPIKDGKVRDNFRIKKALPTITYLKKKGAKLILITHLGKGGDTLAPVAKALNKFIKVKFIAEVIGSQTEKAVNDMKNGEIILLDNLRNNPGEQKCDKKFANNLARYADIYVNEAFSVSHRKDASIIFLPKLLPSYAGLQFVEEIKNLSYAFRNPKHPFLFILGGAKFSTKIPLVNKYLKLADTVFIGGALADDFLKAEDYELGRSLVDDTRYDFKKILKNKKLVLPQDVKVRVGTKLINKRVDEVEKNDTILDVGDRTMENLACLVQKAKLILWNGPLGEYEAGGGEATEALLQFITTIKTESIIGGGDTVDLVSKMKLEKKFSFVSTGGGATLDFLAHGTLPGIKALG